MFKIDLHTHSEASPDGSITPDQYAKYLESESLDYIAITDHDRIDFALGLHKALGEKIIVGQEITTSEGEIIGLYLRSLVTPNQTAAETVKAIHSQGGLVYIPHPFETVRKGITIETLDAIADEVDILEIHNGRALTHKHAVRAATWAKLHRVAGASSSDAHGHKGLGHSYSVVMQKPTRDTLTGLLLMTQLAHRRAPLATLLYPKANRFKKRIGIKK